MQLPNDDSPLCTLCEERPATGETTLSGHVEKVCAACLERLQVRGALEDNLLHILDLERRKKYDEALACLDAILEANRHRDHDGWLANSVALERTSILFDAGRYVEAEQAYRDWAQTGFIDVWRRRLHALGLAKTLEAMGRDREAAAVIEDVLGHDDPNDLPLALIILAELARLSEKLALPVDSKWLRLAEAVAKYHDVGMPTDGSPAKAILDLEGILRSKQQGGSER